MNKNLYEKTIFLLKETPLSLDGIGRSVGMSGRWVRKVRDGVISDPGVKKIQRLHDFLSTSIGA